MLPKIAVVPLLLLSTSCTRSHAFTVQFQPAKITLDQACLQYPDTLARRLFSSVPRREYAVDYVSCQFSSEIVLLQGASSSGKSALMKLILGQEEATSGSVVVDSTQVRAAQPIWLADKPPLDNKRTVRSILENQSTTTGSRSVIQKQMAGVFADWLQLVDVFRKTPAELSPSENYRLRLGEACLQSCLAHIQEDVVLVDQSTLLLPAPILLLDEWLDLETSDCSKKVEEALITMVRATGAVVLCATHKPHLWKQLQTPAKWTSQMTLCRGQILTFQQQQKEEEKEEAAP